jgi:hypothetical protein
MIKNNHLFEQDDFLTTRINLVLEGEIRKQQQYLKVEKNNLLAASHNISSRSADARISKSIIRTEIKILGSVGFGQAIEDDDKHDLTLLLNIDSTHERPKVGYSAVVDSPIAVIIQIERLDMLGLATEVSGMAESLMKYWSTPNKKKRLTFGNTSRTFLFPSQ